MTERTGIARRGFASMTPERQRELAQMGGRAAHVQGTAHEWTSAEATAAGRKGGLETSRRRAAAKAQAAS